MGEGGRGMVHAQDAVELELSDDNKIFLITKEKAEEKDRIRYSPPQTHKGGGG